MLVTGGGGSIGSELCRQVLQFGVAVVCCPRRESSVFEVHQELLTRCPECEVVPVICDVQDGARRPGVDDMNPDCSSHGPRTSMYR